MKLFEETHTDSPKKISEFNRKSQVDTKLGESFYYLSYLDIWKSQNVPLNMDCKLS